MVCYVSVYKVREGKIRLTNIIRNDLIYRQLERVRKNKPCGRICNDQNSRGERGPPGATYAQFITIAVESKHNGYLGEENDILKYSTATEMEKTKQENSSRSPPFP